jgi:hypothetical protein
VRRGDLGLVHRHDLEGSAGNWNSGIWARRPESGQSPSRHRRHRRSRRRRRCRQGEYLLTMESTPIARPAMARPAMSIPALAAPAWIAHPEANRQRSSTRGLGTVCRECEDVKRLRASEAGRLGRGWESGTVPLTDNRDKRAELDRPFSTDLVGGITCEERPDWAGTESAHDPNPDPVSRFENCSRSWLVGAFLRGSEGREKRGDGIVRLVYTYRTPRPRTQRR